MNGDYPSAEIGESVVWTGDGKVLAVQKMGTGPTATLDTAKDNTFIQR